MSRIQLEMHKHFTDESIKALFDKKIFTVLDFIKSDAQLLTNTTRLNFNEIREIKKCLLKKYSSIPINGLDDYNNILKNAAILSTGMKSVDGILGGGLFTGSIYEICGAPSAGKSLFILTVLKNTVLNHRNVYLLDGKRDFVAKSFRNMLATANHDEKFLNDALRCIFIVQTLTKFDLFNTLYSIKNELECDEKRIKLRLIVIDSLPCLLPQNEDIKENNALLTEFVSVIRFIANEFNVAFLISNLTTTWDGGFFENASDFSTKVSSTITTTICGGNYWKNIPDTRLNIKKSTENQCLISIAREETNYQEVLVNITEKGLVDT